MFVAIDLRNISEIYKKTRNNARSLWTKCVTIFPIITIVIIIIITAQLQVSLWLHHFQLRQSVESGPRDIHPRTSSWRHRMSFSSQQKNDEHDRRRSPRSEDDQSVKKRGSDRWSDAWRWGTWLSGSRCLLLSHEVAGVDVRGVVRRRIQIDAL